MAESGSKYSWIYAFFKPWVWAASNGFYKQIIVLGSEHIPSPEKPVILISNHQNGMMDPVMLCLVHSKQLHFLTRSDVFRNPTAGRFFRAINMMPVYRERDGLSDMAERNEAIFNECSERLAGGCTIALFPEGTHGNVKHLRPAKKGVSRLAFSTIQRHPDLTDLVVLPVGMDYSDFIDYRSELRIQYGPAIRVADYLSAYRANPAKAISDLTCDIEEGLRKTVVHYEPAELYPVGRIAYQMVRNAGLSSDEISFSGVFSQKMSALSEKERESLSEDLLAAKRLSKELGLDERAFSPKKNEVLVFFLLSYFWLLRHLARTPPYLWVEHFISGKVKDPHFISSARLVLTMFALPIWWLILSGSAAFVFGNPWLLLLVFVALGMSTIPGLVADDALHVLLLRRRLGKALKTKRGQLLFEQRAALLKKLRGLLSMN